MFIVKWHRAGPRATNEATVSPHNIGDEPIKTEKNYAIITAEDRSVICLSEHRLCSQCRGNWGQTGRSPISIRFEKTGEHSAYP
jgi:hypothetical protein